MTTTFMIQGKMYRSTDYIGLCPATEKEAHNQNDWPCLKIGIIFMYVDFGAAGGGQHWLAKWERHKILVGDNVFLVSSANHPLENLCERVM